MGCRIEPRICGVPSVFWYLKTSGLSAVRGFAGLGASPGPGMSTIAVPARFHPALGSQPIPSPSISSRPAMTAQWRRLKSPANEQLRRNVCPWPGASR
jgi:hypothetical protein